MFQIINGVISLLGTATFLGQIALLIFVVLLLLYKKGVMKWSEEGRFSRFCTLIAHYGIVLSLLISLAAMLFSLFFSEVAKFPPCELCWVQRFFIYPQSLFMLILLFFPAKEFHKKRGFKNPLNYAFAFSIAGLIVASYQYSLQMFESFRPLAATLTPCSLDASSGVSCSSYYFLEYGYITMPMMSITAFTYLIVFQLLIKSSFFKK